MCKFRKYAARCFFSELRNTFGDGCSIAERVLLYVFLSEFSFLVDNK